MKKVIMIHGNIDHGKDFLADLMLLDLKVLNIKAEKISTAKAMKDMTCKFFDITPSELDYLKNEQTHVLLPHNAGVFNFRTFLQRFGSEIKNYFGIAVWAKTLLKDIDSSDSKIILVPDLRYPFEFEEIKRHYAVYTVRIYNDEIPVDTSHHSETSMIGFNFDYEVNNTGRPKSVVQEANKILREILNG